MAHIKVIVTLKPSLLDAQGKVVKEALNQLGHSGVQQVRIGKYIELVVDDAHDIDTQITDMCQKLLSNPVIEDYRFEVSQ